ncbi:probable G- coupled receptor 151 [Pelobates cultripes]|uniref:GPCR-2037 n=1 Tax=Pelobates cultripes TaxID=61616 RepID=A0AAD1RS57_PELCU|nr:probable G- coupled receptor 151 [Pelobates cultripes]
MEQPPANFSTMNSSLHKQPVYAGGFKPLEASDWTLVIPSLLLVICLIGVAGNVCVIAILLHNARKAKPSMIHSLILNLSISDLLLLMFSVPFRAAAYFRSTLMTGWFLCRTADWFTHVCMSSKSISIAVVAKACFMYACNPAKQTNIKQNAVCGVLLAIWLVSALLPLPEWIFTITKPIAGDMACVMDIPVHAHQMMEIFVILYPICVYCAPFTIAFFYFWRAYGQCQRRGTKSQNLRNQIRSRRLTIMLLSVTVTFSILWIPEWVAWLWVWHQPHHGPSPPPAFLAVAQILMFSLSSINPLLFLVMSEEFNEGFKGVWKHLASKKSVSMQEAQEEGVVHSDVDPDVAPSPEQPVKSSCMEQSCSQQNFGSQESKDNPVLPDVEQFWCERESHPSDQDNDPIPWERQEKEPGE